ncbi:hypothetical protein GCM10009719_17360 [Nocardioides kribbensis]
MSTPPSRIRRLFPPSGAAYELWDCAVFVAIIVTVGYVIENPQPAQQETLSFVDQVLSLNLWGMVLATCAIVAGVCAYIPRWISFGYGVLVAGCFFWSAVFVVGIVCFNGQPRSLVSALIYAWVVRRLISTKKRGA